MGEPAVKRWRKITVVLGGHTYRARARPAPLWQGGNRFWAVRPLGFPHYETMVSPRAEGVVWCAGWAMRTAQALRASAALAGVPKWMSAPERVHKRYAPSAPARVRAGPLHPHGSVKTFLVE